MTEGRNVSGGTRQTSGKERHQKEGDTEKQMTLDIETVIDKFFLSMRHPWKQTIQ